MGLADRPGRWPHEILPDPVPDARLPPLRSIEALAARKAQLAEVALARARQQRQAAADAVVAAEDALAARIQFVQEERARQLKEHQATAEGGSALRRWRQADQALLDSIPPCRTAVADSQSALRAAEQALLRAQDEQQRRARRHEKFDMLIEQIVEDA